MREPSNCRSSAVHAAGIETVLGATVAGVMLAIRKLQLADLPA